MSKTFIRWILAPAIIILALESGALAQGLFSRKEQVMYSGDPVDPEVMKLGPWGGGWNEESPQNAYTGSRSIKISPTDLYSGGRIDFVKPVDLTKSFALEGGYLQFMMKFWAQSGYDALTIGIGAFGSTDMYGGVNQARQVRKVRIVMYFDGGKSIESQVDLSCFKLQEDGWMAVSFPMSTLKSRLDMPEYKLNRMVICGDGSEPFHIGEIAVIRDSNPLTAEGGDSKEVSRNYPIAFQGSCHAGAAGVQYAWDFDNSNGLQDEATGDLVYHKFTSAGNYLVTLTVTDVFGIKKSAATTIDVKVNE